MKVCEKVQAKGSTSYNEVADELVNELTDPRCTSPTDQQYDQVKIYSGFVRVLSADSLASAFLVGLIEEGMRIIFKTFGRD